MKPLLALLCATTLAGCVQPVYYPPPPIQLQSYPPPIPYDTRPTYRAPIPAPATEPLPLLQPLPAPEAGPTASPDDSGPIPLTQMPPPATDATPATPAATQSAEPAATAPVTTTKPSTVGPGSNIPLEGFRPMRGQTRPAP